MPRTTTKAKPTGKPKPKRKPKRKPKVSGREAKIAAARAREDAILQMIRSIPEGFVTTYGDLCPEAPRLPGRVLATTAETVPWHRVVRADGSLSQGRRQRKLLDAEGVPFAGKCVLMDDAHLPREALANDI